MSLTLNYYEVWFDQPNKSNTVYMVTIAFKYTMTVYCKPTLFLVLRVLAQISMWVLDSNLTELVTKEGSLHKASKNPHFWQTLDPKQLGVKGQQKHEFVMNFLFFTSYTEFYYKQLTVIQFWRKIFWAIWL